MFHVDSLVCMCVLLLNYWDLERHVSWMNRIRYAQDQNWDTASLLSTFRLLRTDEIVLGISGKLSNSTNHNVFYSQCCSWKFYAFLCVLAILFKSFVALSS